MPRLRLSAIVLAATLFAVPAMAYAKPWDCASDKPATTEAGRAAPVAEAWWLKAAEDNAIAAKWQQPQLVFLGDSLTHRWPDDLWQQEFVPRRAANFGMDGDRVRNLLWRYQNSDDEVRKAPYFVLLIGTNDLGWQTTPNDTADAIRVMLNEIKRQSPQAKILLIGLLPREWSKNRKMVSLIAGTNKALKNCGQRPDVTYLELNDLLVEPDAYQSDELHLSETGYTRILGRLDEALDKMGAVKAQNAAP